MSQTKAFVGVAVVLLVGIAMGLSTLWRPSVEPVIGPPQRFSAERAMRHVRAIAKEPHPPGSVEIDRVRAYIVDQLQTMGLETIVLDDEVAVQTGSGVVASRVQNVVAVVPGSSRDQAILLDAHYDTRAMSPGASDCSSCVASVLEIARALQAGPPLDHDVILLFTDNEEYGGGLGAASFVEAYPGIDSIGLVLNLEGLGSGGPSFLFQTGPSTGSALDTWARTSRFPAGQSWFQEIYGRTPISTDLDWFADSGIPGMNFGYWSGGTAYHTMLDTPERLDLPSVQQQGENALALVRAYELDSPRDTDPEDMVYFGLMPGVLVRYSEAMALPIAGLALLALASVAWLGIQRGQLSVRGGLTGLGGFMLCLILSAALATGLWTGATQLHGEYQAMLTFRGMLYNGYFYATAFAALAVALSSVVLILWRRKVSVPDMILGALIGYSLFALVTGALAPRFSYLLTWPALGGVAALGYDLIFVGDNGDDARRALIAALGALPGLVLIAPAFYLMYQFALAPMIGILALMVALLLGLLIAPLGLLLSRRTWRTVALASAACILLLGAGSLTARFTPNSPRPNAVAHFLDTDAGQGAWFIAGTQTDAWTDQFTSSAEAETVGGLYPMSRRSGFPVRVGQGPTLDLAPPALEALSDDVNDGERRLRVRVKSVRNAPVLTLDMAPYSAVLSATVAGKVLVSPAGNNELWSLTYYAPPHDGIEIEFALDPQREVVAQLSDQTWPMTAKDWAALGVEVDPRSSDMMPMPNFDYGTVVARTIVVP